MQSAFEQLQATFKTGKTKTLEWRRNKINALIRGLEEMAQELSEGVSKDLGRTHFDAELGEISLTVEAANHCLAHLEEYMADIPEKTELLLMPATCVTRYEPLGVIGVYGSWNFPIAMLVKPVIYAIAAGNCVLAKPSEVSANTSAALKRMFDKYMAENDGQQTVLCIEGGVEVGKYMNNLRLDLICFTGSTQVGSLIAQTAAKNLTPCLLELGGKCPVVVDEGADVTFTAKKIAATKLMGCGQICINADYMLV